MISVYLWQLVILVLRIYEILLLARVVLSWVGLERSGLADFVYRATEPVLGPIRQALPATMGMIDFSPLIAFILIDVIRRLMYILLFR